MNIPTELSKDESKLRADATRIIDSAEADESTAIVWIKTHRAILIGVGSLVLALIIVAVITHK